MRQMRVVLVAAAAVVSLGVTAACAAPAGRPVSAVAAVSQQYGPGWELLQEVTGPAGGPFVRTVDLVSPAGRHYQVYRWPASFPVPVLVAWSPDRTRALFAPPGPGNKVMQLTLATGRLSTVRLAGIGFPGPYSPDGQHILDYQLTAGLGLRLVLESLTGGPPVKLPDTVELDSQPAVYSPDGGMLAVHNSHGIVLLRSGGGVIRTLTALPAGCLLVRWWDVGSILASCGSVSRSRTSTRLWVANTTGVSHPLTRVLSDRTFLAVEGAWQLPDGLLYLEEDTASGYRLASLAINGTVTYAGALTTVRVPGVPAGYSVIPEAALGSRLLVRVIAPGAGGGSLLWLDPATGAEQWLIRTPVVVWAIPSSIAPQD